MRSRRYIVLCNPTETSPVSQLCAALKTSKARAFIHLEGIRNRIRAQFHDLALLSSPDPAVHRAESGENYLGEEDDEAGDG